MKDQFASFASYLPPGTSPYWPPDPLTGASAPPEHPWPQNPLMAANLAGGLFENFARPAGGILGNFAGPIGGTLRSPSPLIDDPRPDRWAAPGGPMGWGTSTTPSSTLPQGPLVPPLAQTQFQP
jgi:hypothetical protein